MFKGFGGGRDPFANDPFFQGGGLMKAGFGDFDSVFENAHKMMNEMHNNMDNHFTEISMAGSGSNGLARG